MREWKREKKSLTGKVAECLKNKHYQVFAKVELKNKMESTILMMWETNRLKSACPRVKDCLVKAMVFPVVLY